MDEVLACPGCGAHGLEEIGRSEYRLADDPPADDPGRAWANRAQRDFVFSEWLPGRTRVTLRELLCASCGLVVGSPRPSPADVTRKYAVLVERGITLGHAGQERPGEARRAARLRDRLAPHLGPRPRVLDLGGGDGHLLAALAAGGAACFLVDYAEDPVPGVTRLGATVDELPAGERFDAVVLSHVLEHVAEPAALLDRVARLTSVAYVEVPVELWRGTPIGMDPVTHLNHFTAASLRAVLERRGWRVLRCRGELGTYAGFPLEVAWALATTEGTPGPGRLPPAREARRRLDPSVARRLRRRMRWAAFRALSARRG